VTEDRLISKIQWVRTELMKWLEGIAVMQGFHFNASSAIIHNTQPIRPEDGRLEHSWIVLGKEIWERAELSLHRVNAGTENYIRSLHWTNVREFQRDIFHWFRVWQEPIYHHPQMGTAVRMEAMLTLLIDTLHSLTSNVEVTVIDVSEEALAVLIRLKSHPQPYYAMASMPKHSSTAFNQ
jgi:hypothetical protein